MKTYPVIDPKATGLRIKEFRKARNLSVTDICNFMGFENPQAVYKWQRGESLPSVDNLFALSRLFQTTVDNLLCEKGEATASPSFFALSQKLNYEFNDEKLRGCYNRFCNEA